MLITVNGKKEVFIIRNWIELSKKEYKYVWERVNKEFNFKPSISEFPSISVPSPFITYDISYLSGELDNFDIYFNELEEKLLLAFQKITNKNEYIYALDWQHECYLINPFLVYTKGEYEKWHINVFPDGDYYFFIQREFKWGYIGHPWEKTITIYGEKLINALDKDNPTVFQKVLRKG